MWMIKKIGVISCAGEEIPEGTVSRTATRIVIEDLCPDNTLTICLPLFTAGHEEERAFAINFPTIAVDGCEKRCAEKGIRRFTGNPPDATIIVTDIMKKCNLNPKSRVQLDEEGKRLAMKVAEAVAEEVDKIMEKQLEQSEIPE